MSEHATAIELARAIVADPRAIVPLVAKIDDPNTARPERIDAMLALALAGNAGVAIPGQAFDLLEDDVLVDALLATESTAAITGLLAIAGDRVSAAQRRYLGIRIGAADSSGTHVASLLLAQGEIESGVRIAATALIAGTRDRGADDIQVVALAEVGARWTARHGDAVGKEIVARLTPAARRTLAIAASALPAHRDSPWLRALED